MPLCGFNTKMIEGIARFSEGLFEATIERGALNRLNAADAVKTEIREIEIFIVALQDKYGINVENSRKIGEMIYGIAIFSGALLESTFSISTDRGADLKEIYGEQVNKISTFLEHLENKHQELKKTLTPEQTMIKAVQWIDENDM